MDKKLIEKYKEYANTEEAFAVLFVKKHLRAAKGKWVDIIDFYYPYNYAPWELEFKYVECRLFSRKRKPQYPPKKDFKDEKEYIQACRAITWETANIDISE